MVISGIRDGLRGPTFGFRQLKFCSLYFCLLEEKETTGLAAHARFFFCARTRFRSWFDVWVIFVVLLMLYLRSKIYDEWDSVE